MTPPFTLETFTEFVNRCGGTIITASRTPMRIGEPEDMLYRSDDVFPLDEGFRVRQVAIREATRAEYLSCRWPGGNLPDLDGWKYYEIAFD